MGKPDQAGLIAMAIASREHARRAPGDAGQTAIGPLTHFQQRARPGWFGTLAQVTDPMYAADTAGRAVRLERFRCSRVETSQPVIMNGGCSYR
jgi:hypothetical protein